MVLRAVCGCRGGGAVVSLLVAELLVMSWAFCRGGLVRPSMQCATCMECVLGEVLGSMCGRWSMVCGGECEMECGGEYEMLYAARGRMEFVS